MGDDITFVEVVSPIIALTGAKLLKETHKKTYLLQYN
jgi:hypothetical protein